MTCDDFKADVGAYALGSLEASDDAAMEAHLAEVREHEGCPEALERARGAVRELDRLPSSAPPAAVWSRIEHELQRGGAGAAHRRVAAWAGWGAAAVAATLLLIVLSRRHAARGDLAAALTSSQENAVALAAERDRCREELARLHRSGTAERAVVALLSDPGTRVVPMGPQPGKQGHATVILNGGSARALVVTAQLHAVQGKTLQLWVIRGGAPPVPAGFLQQQDRDWMQGEIAPALLRAGPPDAVAISLEPAGGSPTPSDVLLLGKVRL